VSFLFCGCWAKCDVERTEKDKNLIDNLDSNYNVVRIKYRVFS